MQNLRHHPMSLSKSRDFSLSEPPEAVVPSSTRKNVLQIVLLMAGFTTGNLRWLHAQPTGICPRMLSGQFLQIIWAEVQLLVERWKKPELRIGIRQTPGQQIRVVLLVFRAAIATCLVITTTLATLVPGGLRGSSAPAPPLPGVWATTRRLKRRHQQ